LVCFRPHGLSSQRQPETWPTRARVVLVLRAEQRRIAAYASIRAIGFVIDEFPRKRSFRRRALRDLVLLRTEPVTQILVVAATHPLHRFRFRAAACSSDARIQQDSPAGTLQPVAHDPARYATARRIECRQTRPTNGRPAGGPH